MSSLKKASHSSSSALSNVSGSIPETAIPASVAATVTVTPAVATTALSAMPDPAFLAKVAQATSLLDQAIALFNGGTDLTGVDRIRGTKMRKGGTKIVPLVAQAAKQAGIDLPQARVAPMEQNLAEAQALLPVQAKIGILQKQVDDHVFDTEGASWATAMALYAVLRRLARNNGQLATTLAPATEFFKYKTPAAKADAKAKKAAKPTTGQVTQVPTVPTATQADSVPVAAVSPPVVPASEAPASVAAPVATAATTGAAHS